MQAFIGLGSNLGDRLAHCQRALAGLRALPGLEVVARSSWYETRAVGAARKPFINAVARVRARMSAIELMTALLELERAAGRTRTIEHGDRTLDLDILLALDDAGMPTPVCEHGPDHPSVIVPHPRLAERDFVLAPLAELAPDLQIDGTSCAELLRALPTSARTITRVLR